METRKMKLALSAGALALSLALAGCGGGGSSGTPSGPTQAELDAANQQAAEEKAAKEKAEMEKAAEEAARKEAEEKLAEKEAAERKAAAAASLKDAMALFDAAEEDANANWDHEEGPTLDSSSRNMAARRLSPLLPILSPLPLTGRLLARRSVKAAQCWTRSACGPAQW